MAIADAETPAETPFTWVGNPWSLAGACLFNALMTVVTVGIYNFWGRTEIRRRMWSCVRLEGEPLVYRGTGLEMFKGFMAALFVVLVPLFLLGVLFVIVLGQGSPGWGTFQLALIVIVYPVLKALATYRARRYRLSRTSWRGINGSLAGSAGEFAFLTWAVSLLTPLTLGWIGPWRALYVQRFLIDDTMLGDRKLRLEGNAARLYGRFALLWVGTIVIATLAFLAIGAVAAPTIGPLKNPADFAKVHFSGVQAATIAGIIAVALFVWGLASSFYRSGLYNLTANSTIARPVADATGRISDLPVLRFKLTTRSSQLIWLFVTNALITYLSLYILKPVATARSLRYFVRHLSVVGAFDPTRLGANPNAIVTDGEGLAQAFDFDAF